MEEIVFSDIAYYSRFATAGVLAVVGTFSNGVSLSFFLRKQKESLADKHLIALNVTDLLICCLFSVVIFCLSEYSERQHDFFDRGEDMKNVRFEIYKAIIGDVLVTLTLLSCFITAMLSVTRTLALTKPLYTIKGRRVFIAHSTNAIFVFGLFSSKVFSIYILEKQEAREAYTWKNDFFVFYMSLYAVEYSYVLTTVVIVALSSLIIVRKLREPPKILTKQAGRQNRETSRKATLMILTLMLIFVTINGAWCVFWSICTAVYRSSKNEDTIIMTTFSYFLNVFLITINSCANPVVYMLRNSRLNYYTKSLFTRLTTFIR